MPDTDVDALLIELAAEIRSLAHSNDELIREVIASHDRIVDAMRQLIEAIERVTPESAP